MKIDASELDQRVTIEQSTIARDPDFGSEVPTWSTFAEVWGRFVDQVTPAKGGDELVAEAMRLTDRRTQLKLRHLEGVTQGMRVQWPARSRTFQITGISELGRREGLLLTLEQYSV